MPGIFTSYTMLVFCLVLDFPASSGVRAPGFHQGQGRRRGLGSDFFLGWSRVETRDLELWEGGRW